MSKTVLFQTIPFNISIFFVYTQLNKTFLFQNIQFNISTQFNSAWSKDRTISGSTTLAQSGPVSDGNKGVLHVSQSSSITGTSPADCLASYSDTCGRVLLLCRDSVSVFYNLNKLGHVTVLVFMEIN